MKIFSTSKPVILLGYLALLDAALDFFLIIKDQATMDAGRVDANKSLALIGVACILIGGVLRNIERRQT